MSIYSESVPKTLLDDEDLYGDFNDNLSFSSSSSSDSIYLRTESNQTFFNFPKNTSTNSLRRDNKSDLDYSFNGSFSSDDEEEENGSIIHSFSFSLPNEEDTFPKHTYQPILVSDDSGIVTNNVTPNNYNTDTSETLKASSSDTFFSSLDIDSFILNCPGVSTDEEDSNESCISEFLDMSDDDIYTVLDNSDGDSYSEYFTTESL
uniref:Iwr1 domain-containing protein n=1 Tax=Strongyloides stercoralis TaxID=6248 RepID=A0A0K0EAL0_STRER